MVRFTHPTSLSAGEGLDQRVAVVDHPPIPGENRLAADRTRFLLAGLDVYH